MFARFSALILGGSAVVTINALLIIPALATGAEGITTFTGSSSGAIVGAINSSNGVGISGSSGNAGIAVQGSIGATNSGVGVRGVTYGPGSTAVIGEAKNTNVSSPSTGLKGYSKSGSGVVGQTFANTGSPATSFAGVLGQDTGSPNNFGVEGTSIGGTGIRGISQANLAQPAVDQADAVVGTSHNHRGVHGISIFDVGVRGDSINSIAVEGIANANTGVYGQSTSGVGVQALSTNGAGIMGESVSNYGIYAQSINATALKASSNSNIGVIAETGSGAYPALVAQSDGGATPSPVVPVVIVKFATTQSCGGTLTTDIFTISQKGDVAACGTITASTTPLVIRRTTIGQHLVSYAAQQSQPTIEDLGESTCARERRYRSIVPEPSLAPSTPAPDRAL